MSYIERVWFVYIYNGVRIRGAGCSSVRGIFISGYEIVFFFLLGALQRNDVVVVTRNAAKG